MQVARVQVKEKEETAAISERQAIEVATLWAIRKHRVSPDSVLAVDVVETIGSWIVYIYVKYSPIVVVVEVEKTGKVFSSCIRALWGE